MPISIQLTSVVLISTEKGTYGVVSGSRCFGKVWLKKIVKDITGHAKTK